MPTPAHAIDHRPGPAAEAFAPSQTLPVLGGRPGLTVEAIPGRRIELRDPEPLDRHCIAELVPLGGGTYRVVPRLATIWLRFARDVVGKLGIGISGSTMRRLGEAGFIKIRQISPSCYEFDYASWLAHCAAVEADPEFWDTVVQTPAGRMTNRERYVKLI